MSAAKVAKLEALLERVQTRRTEQPTVVALRSPSRAAAQPAAKPVALEIDEPQLEVVATPAPAIESPSPTPSPGRAVSPTPMEHALKSAADSDEPVLEISVDDDEPELTIEEHEEAPTAPLGTPSPVNTPAVSARTPAPAPRSATPSPALRSPALQSPTPRSPTPSPAAASPVAAKESSTGPTRVATSIAKPSSPVAKVTRAAAPRTFGELLERTLALRPR